MRSAAFEQTQPQDYLTRLAASDLGKSYKSMAVGELGIAPGDVVLDLGCGPGVDLAAFARAAGPSGTVIGVDNDPLAIDQARDRTTAHATVQLRHADVHATGIPGSAVDRIHTDRVVQHVADPRAMMREAQRVIRPTGQAVFVEPDWDTLIIEYPDLEVPRAYRTSIVDHVVRNACIGRQLTGLAERTEFAVSGVFPSRPHCVTPMPQTRSSASAASPNER